MSNKTFEMLVKVLSDDQLKLLHEEGLFTDESCPPQRCPLCR